MPELPEVETLKRELARVLVGKKIATFQSEKFKLDLVGKRILAVNRRAKILIFKLPGGESLLIHLKMTGQLIYSPRTKSRGQTITGGHPQINPFKYTRAIFTFTDHSKLFFNDLRKFGWLKIVGETELQKLLGETGVEPLQPDFTSTKFSEILARYPKRKIKQSLLDQSVIAGLGNIYVDESLFRGGILPTRLVGNLTPNDVKKLHRAIVEVLKLAIQKKGTSSRNYRRTDGTPGGFVPYLNVYGRGREKCKVCGTEIVKIKLNGRGTHYCPRCQR